jgi:hypothetical protein
MSEKDINRWHADLRRFSEPKRLANGLVDFNRWEPAPITDEMLAELTQLFSYSGAPWNCRSLPLTPSDREYMYLLYCSMQGIVSRMRQSDAFAAELLALLIELTDIEGPLPGTQSWHTKAMAAIAKATGGQ